MKKDTRDMLATVAQAGCGLAIAAGAAVAWHVFGVNGTLAALIALGGLGMVSHAFGYHSWF